MIMKLDNMNGYGQPSRGQSYNVSGNNKKNYSEDSGPVVSRTSKVGVSML